MTTIDQGQDNDYILVSLVRTRNLGYLTDVRRLITAMGCARLGLYVFYRKELFQNTVELSPIFHQVRQISKLQLMKQEFWPPCRLMNDAIPGSDILEIDDVTAMGLKVYEMTIEATRKSK